MQHPSALYKMLHECPETHIDTTLGWFNFICSHNSSYFYTVAHWSQVQPKFRDGELRDTHRDMPANMCTELLGSGLHHWLPNKNQRLASHRIQDYSTIYLKQLTFIWFQSPMQITSGPPFVKLFWCPHKYMDVSYLYADTISLNPTIRFQVSDT
jgi:hypothetical protein